MMSTKIMGAAGMDQYDLFLSYEGGQLDCSDDALLEPFDNVVNTMLAAGNRPAKGDILIANVWGKGMRVSDGHKMTERACARVAYVEVSVEDDIPFFVAVCDKLWWDSDWPHGWNG